MARDEPDLKRMAKLEASLLPLWPLAEKPLTWPPNGPRLDDSGFDELADTFGSVPTA